MAVWGAASPWGITTWSSRGAVAALTPVVSTDGREAQDAQLGTTILFDGNYHLTAARTFAIITGFPALNQGIYHRLITVPGDFKARPGYGVGVQRWVKRINSTSRLYELEQTVEDQLSFDRRITRVKKIFVANFDGNEPGVKLGFDIEAGGKSISFQPLVFAESGVRSA